MRMIDALMIAGLMLCASALRAAQGTQPAGAEQILVGAGKTRLIDMPVDIERVSIAAPLIAEAVPVSARSLMVNGKTPDETSLVIWLSDGSRESMTWMSGSPRRACKPQRIRSPLNSAPASNWLSTTNRSI
jgi:Flp pilus assembly secretin CpaC